MPRPLSVTGVWQGLSRPSCSPAQPGISTVRTRLAWYLTGLGTAGKAMETSPGSSSQTPDHSQVLGNTEDVDCAEHEKPDLLKDELQLYGGAPGEVVPAGESGLRRRGSNPASGDVEEASQLRRLNIKKDDEFFHFVLLCFAIGALLVCYHYYADWFMSLGVGLLTFASLETVGIYFGLVYRIHSTLRGFIPLFQKLRLIGFRRTD